MFALSKFRLPVPNSRPKAYLFKMSKDWPPVPLWWVVRYLELPTRGWRDGSQVGHWQADCGVGGEL